jgi:hypothetical protein
MVHIGDKWKPFKNVHSIADLFGHWATLIETNEMSLKDLSKTNFDDWLVTPEFREWISTIEKTDRTSTYYRYPTTTEVKDDSYKSSFKDSSLKEVLESKPHEGKSVVAMIVENAGGEVSKAFVLDRGAEEEETEALLRAVEFLNNFHAMMRMELADGW